MSASRLVRFTRAFGAVAVCLSVVACVADIPITPQTDDRPPRYRTGETLVYASGYRVSVTGVDGWRVSMRDNRGTRWIRSRNPALPALHVNRGKTRVTVTLDKRDRDILWPPRAGNRETFSTRVDAGAGLAPETRVWSCRIEGGEYVTIPAGRFRTIRYRCGSRGAAGQESHVLNFAPDLGKVIRDSRNAVQLVAILPPYARMPGGMRHAARSHVQQVLEHEPTGPSFQHRDGRMVSTVTISRTFKDSRGIYCRRYVQTLTGSPAYSGHYPALACRDPDSKRWVVGKNDQ